MPQESLIPSLAKKATNMTSKEFKTLAVIAAIAISQGLIMCVSTIWNYVYKDDFQLSPSQASLFSTATTLPWTFKPVWGILSDNVPIFGYRRKPYVIFMTFVGWMCFLAFGLFHITTTQGFFLLVAIAISQSSQSVVGQALTVERAKLVTQNKSTSKEEKEKASSNNVSTFFGLKACGRVVYSSLITLFLTTSNKHQFLLATSFVPLSVLLISCFLPEEKVKKANPSLMEGQATALQERLINPIDDQIANQELDQPVQAAPEMSNFRRAWIFVRQPLVYKSMFLIFLAHFAPTSAQAKFDYYTNDLGFSPTLMGGLNLTTCLASTLGIFIYNRFFSTVSLRKFYTFICLLCTLLSLSQLILIFRINLQYGIPDAVFVILDSFLNDVSVELMGMPLLVLACKVCPKNIEATVFAVMIALIAVGNNLSSISGAIIVEYLGMTLHNFENLWILMVITASFAMLPLFLVWIVDYDKEIKKMDQSQLNEENEETRIRSNSTGLRMNQAEDL